MGNRGSLYLMTRTAAFMCTVLLTALSAAAQPVNYQGRWSAALAGTQLDWRLNITQRGSAISASWTMRSQTDNSLSTYSLRALSTESNTFTGPLYRSRIVQTPAQPPKGKGVYPVIRLQREREPLGTATFVFSDQNNGSLTYQERELHISRVP